MSAPNWHDLLRDLDTFPSVWLSAPPLSAEQVEQLQSISRAADAYSRTLGFGISAIGHLLANAALGDGDIQADTAINLGWLLESLGELSAKLADVGECARDRLTTPTSET